MSNSEVTKQALADAFAALAEKTPVDKITVGRLTAACGLNRQTFYYHFQDMFDLVEWMLGKQAVQAVGSQDWRQALEEIFGFIKGHRAFCINLSRSQMRPQLHKFLYQLLYSGIAEKTAALADEKQIRPEESRFVTAFYTTAIIGVLQWWLEHQKEGALDALVPMLELVMDGALEQSMDKFESMHKEK